MPGRAGDGSGLRAGLAELDWTLDAGFETVADAFERKFVDLCELGAAVAVVHRRWPGVRLQGSVKGVAGGAVDSSSRVTAIPHSSRSATRSPLARRPP
jgi:hypothetical protein